MLENQFIQINSPYIYWGGRMPLPIEYNPNGIYIFIEGSITSLSVVKEDGSETTVSTPASTAEYKTLDILTLLLNANLSIGECFAFKSYKDDVVYRYSNRAYVRVPSDGFSILRYRCSEDAFGFPFTQTSNLVSFPVLLTLNSPQYSQDSKSYERKNGNVITLFAKYYKEWEGETDYLSEAMHDKIIAALSCDEVFINGKRVTKTDNYQIDWENYDLDCDGKTKLARATFKVRENITQRNSNY